MMVRIWAVRASSVHSVLRPRWPGLVGVSRRSRCAEIVDRGTCHTRVTRASPSGRLVEGEGARLIASTSTSPKGGRPPGDEPSRPGAPCRSRDRRRRSSRGACARPRRLPRDASGGPRRPRGIRHATARVSIVQAIAFGDLDRQPTIVTRWNPLSRDAEGVRGVRRGPRCVHYGGTCSGSPAANLGASPWSFASARASRSPIPDQPARDTDAATHGRTESCTDGRVPARWSASCCGRERDSRPSRCHWPVAGRGRPS